MHQSTSERKCFTHFHPSHFNNWPRDNNVLLYASGAAAAGGKARDAVAVNSYGKLKTATQLVALSVLLGVRDGCGWVHLTGASEVWLINSGLICLWLSAGLALISLWIYMAGVVEFMS